ncbi:MAG: DoxX family protein [Gammaproteobacteria bacterium]|nr:MAG: DoxX family protein [Gammaproteobacteria bacterium]
MNTLCNLAKQYGPLLGRLLLANIFIVYGLKKIMGFAGTAGYMASKGLPLPEVLLVLTILIELGGGLMILLGWQARWAALAIFLWLIPVTLIFHAYWDLEPAQMVEQQRHFMKNLAIMGGMIYIVAFGPGAFSLGKDKC